MTDDADAGEWIDLGPVAEMEFDPGARVAVAGREIAIFPSGACYFALENYCPHAGGELADGSLLDGEIACNWHGWRFDIRTGVCKTVDSYAVPAHETRLADGRLAVRLRPL
jgi:nitrite reductase/ring-hydroxylating ferredoxin subunit